MKFLGELALLCGGVAATAVKSHPKGYCCDMLQTALGDKVLFPRDEEYTESIEGEGEDLETGYWSITAQLTPECIVKARCTEDVSVAVSLLAAKKQHGSCKFAVRGGGHSPWPSNNIENGVTIDLSYMNQTVYNADSSTATIGAGSRWVQVYEELSPLGVTVPGGRAGTVGVAGLTLGGGNSFFAARTGLVCDNVANYTIVDADGKILNANADSHPDLWQALKGGSNNFGVVTHFEMFAFEQGDLWGGVVLLPGTDTDDLIPAFVNFNNKIRDDPYVSLISFWQYSNWIGSTNIINAWEYTKPVENPPAFDELRSVSTHNTSDSMRITNMTDLTAELVQAYGYRDSFHANQAPRAPMAVSLSTAAHNYVPSPPPSQNQMYNQEPVQTPGAQFYSTNPNQQHKPLQHIQPQYPDYLGSSAQSPPPQGGYSQYSYNPAQQQPQQQQGGNNQYDVHSQVYRPTEAEHAHHRKPSKHNTNNAPQSKWETRAEKVEKKGGKFLKKLGI